MEDALTDSMYLILIALVKPQHGYAIMKEITSLTQGRYQIGPASMYTILKKLLEEKWITLEESDDRKKIYVITQSGVDRLHQEVLRREKFLLAGQIALELVGDEYEEKN